MNKSSLWPLQVSCTTIGHPEKHHKGPANRKEESRDVRDQFLHVETETET